MANAAKLAATNPARVLIVGYPGSGKTGSLVALANAGLKLRVLAFDKAGNMQTLIALTRPDMRKNIDIVYLEDRLVMGPKVMGVDKPHAFADSAKIMNHWKYKEADGTEVDLGKPANWGLDTVVVLDTITSQGDAALRRARFMHNKTIADGSDRVFGLAMAEQEAFIEMMNASENGYHTVSIAHMKIIGPRDVRKGEDDLTEALKRKQAEIVPTKFYPSALGWQLPQSIGRHFPTILEAERVIKGLKVSHVLKTITNTSLDLRIPAADMPRELSTEDGLVKVFDAVSPGWRAAVEASVLEKIIAPVPVK